MRLTMRANLAMRVLMQCAVNHPKVIRAGDVAQACNASANHVAQVVSQLAGSGYLRTLRGRGGGIALGRPADTIQVGKVLHLIEREVPLAECMAGDQNTCPLCAVCRLKDALSRAMDAFYRELETVTLADLITDNDGLVAILGARMEPA